MFNIRQGEQKYAFLSDEDSAETNRYGKSIKLVTDEGVSLRINGDPGLGATPNRTRQHGFHFTADNCIGCHACEAACSEKNDLPAHLSFRSVGYLEGGSYPAYVRMNISMACNHCDDPVCLKGCPTRAYTKHAEYGAVIQDPDICFGCGYCTWVCPYNAPQLDPLDGRVQKCNMCVDRLEMGLKPACVSACLGNALNFGVIGNLPDNRDQTETRIPGFPSPDITHPNIRFQQTKSLPRRFSRPDSMPIEYHRKEDIYGPVPDERGGRERRWNWARLSSRENPLVLFTLVTQAVIGAFLLSFLGGLYPPEAYLPLLSVMLSLQALVLGLSTSHLGNPFRFYRGFNNLRYSPLSREALSIALFFGFLTAHFIGVLFGQGILTWLDRDIANAIAELFAWLALASGLAGLYFICAVYRIKARPFWNHWQVTTSCLGTALTLGSTLIAIVSVPLLAANGFDHGELMTPLAGIMATGMAVEGIGHLFHARDLKRHGGEGAASLYLQSTTFGKTYRARNIHLAGNLLAVMALSLSGMEGWTELVAWATIAISILANSLIGRALFYVAVIPTTMPGAFFWKNKGFEEHARETGLANMPQVGVAPDVH